MLVFVLVCITVSPFYFCNHLDEEERAGCFVFYCFFGCPAAIPCGAVGWYVVCDCGIS